MRDPGTPIARVISQFRVGWFGKASERKSCWNCILMDVVRFLFRENACQEQIDRLILVGKTVRSVEMMRVN